MAALAGHIGFGFDMAKAPTARPRELHGRERAPLAPLSTARPPGAAAW